MLAASCTQNPGATAGSGDSVAVIDGHAISRSTFKEYVQTVSSAPLESLSEAQLTGLLENLVRAQVLAREAESSGVAKQEATLAKLDLHRLNVLGQALNEQYLKDHKTSEQELRAEYNLKLAAMPRTEYHAAHILVPTEEAARQIIAKLKAGASFAELARKESTDTGSGEKGGDLDWFSPASMTPPFAEAVTRLARGQTSAAPVQTEFGWHVIRVMDTRPAVAPAFDAVKEELEKILNNRKSKAYVDELVGKAKITRSL
jgi:peptidyl-prolyl cis-trans isomerase C